MLQIPSREQCERLNIALFFYHNYREIQVMIKIIRKKEQKCFNFTLLKYSFSKKEKKKKRK
jgi:hypothetical protein